MRPVAVGGVHQQVAEERRPDQKDPPALRSAHGCPPPREEPQTRPDHEAERNQPRQRVTVTAMVKEVAERRLGDARVEQIHVRRVRRENTRTHEDGAHPRRRAARQGAFRHRGSDKGMRDIVHVTLMLPHALSSREEVALDMPVPLFDRSELLDPSAVTVCARTRMVSAQEVRRRD